MAKTKKNVPSKDEENNVPDVNNEAEAPKKTKLSKTLIGKRFASRAENPPTGEMVVAAIKALNNDKEGVLLLNIHKYMFKNFGGFGRKISKQRRDEIKEFMVAEFEEGRIVMTNADPSDFIKKFHFFGARFNIVAD